ncbi:hypothetical protein B4U79_18950, partial [Dinothrombium tinctorium]
KWNLKWNDEKVEFVSRVLFGHRIELIAQELGRSCITIKRIWNRFLEDRTIERKVGTGLTRKIDATRDERIISFAIENRWKSLNENRIVIAPNLTINTFRNRLKEVRIRRHVAAKKLDADHIEERLQYMPVFR